MKLLALALTSLALVATMPRSGRTCGAFVPAQVDGNPAIAAQRALIVVRADTIEMHLQPHAEASADFAWIIPVPSLPTLALGDTAVFEALDSLTVPSVSVEQDGGGGGIGCGSADGKAGGGQRFDGLQHFGGGTLGDYAYDTISGSSAAVIEAWLTDNGYVVPEGFAAAVAPYVGKPFVAVKLAPTAIVGSDLEPLVISFARPFDNALGYALGLSKLSSTDVAPVLLWVLAAKRHRVANYASTDVQVVGEIMREQAEGGREVDYEAAVTQLTQESGGRIAITEFARELDPAVVVPELAALVDADAHYLTRIYMQVPKAEIEDLVITFSANAPDVDPNVVAEAASGEPTTAACIGLAVFGLVLMRRRGASRA